ncbi:hypothetical protein PJJ87_29140, partial [Mycobacterium kansasii]
MLFSLEGKAWNLTKCVTVQDMLSNAGDTVGEDTAAITLKEKRLTFTWLDGEVQSRRCLFYIHSEYNYETCGPR